jgi:hypothetical protein
MSTNIDNDAKLRVNLVRLTDDHDNDYFVGKLQFPGDLQFKKGISFMVFVSEQGTEELQIGPVDERKQSPKVLQNRGIRTSNKIHIDLHALTDAYNKRYYLGEARGPMHIECEDGIFIAIFTSREGQEELQIGSLDHSRKKKFEDRDTDPVDEA